MLAGLLPQEPIWVGARERAAGCCSTNSIQAGETLAVAASTDPLESRRSESMNKR